MMDYSNLQYEVETKTVMLQGKPITLVNRTPVFTPEQREKQRQAIERQLYGVVKRHLEKVC